jgi:hypothetical protein
MKRFRLFSGILLLTTSILFLFILFSKGYTADTRIVILMYWGYFSSFSSILLVPYYQVPSLVLNLVSHSKELAEASWNLILKNPSYYIKPMFHSYKFSLPPGMDFSEENFQVELEWIIQKFQLEDRIDWKKIGKRYLLFYSLVTPVLFYFFFQGLTS